MNHANIRFEYLNSRDEVEVESLWAIERDEGVEIDNIPFHITEIVLGDVVAVEKDDQGLLWFSKLVKASVHSTVQLWFAKEEDVPHVREDLDKLGCSSELSELSRLVAVDIPPEISYSTIKAYLDDGKQRELFEYQEACLGFL